MQWTLPDIVFKTVVKYFIVIYSWYSEYIIHTPLYCFDSDTFIVEN